MHYICQIKCLEEPDLHYPFLQFHFALPPVLHIMWYMNLCFTQEFLNILRTKEAVFDQQKSFTAFLVSIQCISNWFVCAL